MTGHGRDRTHPGRGERPAAKDAGQRAERFAVCHNPEQAERDRAVREWLIAHLGQLIDGSDAWTRGKRDELAGSLKDKPGLRRLPRRTRTGLLRAGRAAAARETRLDGRRLLRTNDHTLAPEDLAAAYKQLIAVERGWRDIKGALRLRPVSRHREDRIRTHVQLCWLALLLIRVAENAAGDTWRNLHHEDRMHLGTLATRDGRVAQRSAATPSQQIIFQALELREPPKFFDFTPLRRLTPDTEAGSNTPDLPATRVCQAQTRFTRSCTHDLLRKSG